VVPQAQGRGLGKRIFEVLLAELDTVPHDRLTLEVEADNTAAIRLYEHHGFRRASRMETRLKYTAQ
jgi:ribosomal protein S18 acetylase RimI-like enzyme